MKSLAILLLLLQTSAALAKGAADDVSALADKQAWAWSKDAAEDSDAAVAANCTADAVFVVTGGAFGDDVADATCESVGSILISAVWTVAHAITNKAVGVAADGKTAWISYTYSFTADATESGVKSFPKRTFRVSEIAIATPKGWKLAGGMYSQDRDNAAVNATALSGSSRKLAPLPAGDRELAKVFTELVGAPLPAAAGTRKDLVAIGSGPRERTVGGAGFKKAWDGSWAGKLTIDGPISARIAPSGTTGWVVANVKLAKKKGVKSYQIPFRLLVVFDKDAAGSWTLVHAHFAVL